MEKSYLEKLITENLSIRQIASLVNKSSTTIRHWLNKYNLKTNHKRFNKSTNDPNTKKCPICKKIKTRDQFYKNKGGSYSYCIDCCKNIYKEKSITKKIWAINYKGNKCLDCGLSYPDNSYVIYDFHHLNPAEKNKEWKQMKMMNETNMIHELDKCVLLCSNCHRLRHYGN